MLYDAATPWGVDNKIAGGWKTLFFSVYGLTSNSRYMKDQISYFEDNKDKEPLEGV